jgi:hypothetical protein
MEQSLGEKWQDTYSLRLSEQVTKFYVLFRILDNGQGLETQFY